MGLLRILTTAGGLLFTFTAAKPYPAEPYKLVKSPLDPLIAEWDTLYAHPTAEPTNLTSILLSPPPDTKLRITRPLTETQASYYPSSHLSEGFRWDASDDNTKKWTPVGITTSEDSNIPSESTFLAVSWQKSRYPRFRDRLQSPYTGGAKISFVLPPGQPGSDEPRKYIDVVPVHLISMEGSGIHFQHLREPWHIGTGILWLGQYVYLSAGVDGILVFDTTKIYKVRKGIDMGYAWNDKTLEPEYQAEGFQYVMPLAYKYSPQFPSSSNFAFTFLALDKKTDPPGILAGEYIQTLASTRFIRWGLDSGATNLLQGDIGNSTVSTANWSYQITVIFATGVVPRGENYLVARRGYGGGEKAEIVIWEPTKLQKGKKVLPFSSKGVGYQAQGDVLWALSDSEGRRMIVGLRAAEFAGKLETGQVKNPGNGGSEDEEPNTTGPSGGAGGGANAGIERIVSIVAMLVLAMGILLFL